MSPLIEKINCIKLARRQENLLKGLDKFYEIVSSEIKEEHKALFREGFEKFRKTGRYSVHNTFAGGIIFLREPEIIEKIKIDFKTVTNDALAEVEYSTEIRNKRNTKYKPNAGKTESIDWNMLGVFPHFNKYDKGIKIAILTLIGNFVKVICEDLNQNSWFMKYEKNFELEIILDNEMINKLSIKAK